MDGGRRARHRGGAALSSPEEAGAAARAAAERKRAEGVYGDPAPGPLDEAVSAEVPSLEDLERWAAIEVDPEAVYSTRKAGAPITVVKRLLLRLLRQYHVELEAKQTRFNVAVVERLRELERRSGE